MKKNLLFTFLLCCLTLPSLAQTEEPSSAEKPSVEVAEKKSPETESTPKTEEKKAPKKTPLEKATALRKEAIKEKRLRSPRSSISPKPAQSGSVRVKLPKRFENRSVRNRAASFWKEEWNDSVYGSPFIKISLSSQIARFYRGNKLVGQSPISSGRPGFDTSEGDYTILQKEREHFSNLYGSFVDSNGRTVRDGDYDEEAPPGTTYQPSAMPYFLRLTNAGLGMHAGFVPNYPASHGCIRLPRDMAKKFYENAKLGTPVEVY